MRVCKLTVASPTLAPIRARKSVHRRDTPIEQAQRSGSEKLRAVAVLVRGCIGETRRRVKKKACSNRQDTIQARQRGRVWEEQVS